VEDEMTDRFEPRGSDTPLRPLGSTDDARSHSDDDGRDRLADLPEHELDDDATVGGGVMSQGGTAIDRGTGTLSGEAQGADDDADDSQRVGGVGDDLTA
jgi:hypothetical protein